MNNEDKVIVVVDFSGTLIKSFVAEEASNRRYKILGIAMPDKKDQKQLHATKKHYDIIRETIKDKYGVADDLNITRVNDYADEVQLTGKDVQTSIMTDLFRLCMYGVAQDEGTNIYAERLLPVLEQIQKKGYKLAIVSGIRTDVITGMFAITKCPITFDYVYGQDSVLSRDDNEFLDKELAKQGTIKFIIGDKLSDLEPAKKLGAKSIFVKWGHATGGEEEFADYTIDSAEELSKIIK